MRGSVDAVQFLAAQAAELDQVGGLRAGVGADVDRAAGRVHADHLRVLDGDLAGEGAVGLLEGDDAVGRRVGDVEQPLRRRPGRAAR